MIKKIALFIFAFTFHYAAFSMVAPGIKVIKTKKLEKSCLCIGFAKEIKYSPDSQDHVSVYIENESNRNLPLKEFVQASIREGYGVLVVGPASLRFADFSLVEHEKDESCCCTIL